MATIPRPEVFRQSLVQGSTLCARRTLHGLMLGQDDLSIGWVESTGDLGTAWHEYMHAYLKTLGAADEPQMATQEAVEVMYEVLARLPFSLPWDDLDALRGMVLGFCDIKWNPKLLATADYERELRAEVVCPDGEVRVSKGTPDVLMFDPPDGLLIIDAKTGKGKPKSPRVEPEPGVILQDRRYLSDLFQGDNYSFLALRAILGARWVKFREYHLRSGQIREGLLTREQMEHVERKLGLLMMRLDDGISEGPESKFWRPRPGKHCNRQCPVSRSCPIPEEMRGVGAIESEETADRVAGAYVVAKAQYTQAADQLKSWEEAGNRAGRANEREEVRWDPPGSFAVKGNGRKFGLWPRVDFEEVEANG